MSRALKRDANERALVNLLRRLGASVFLLHQPVDLLVGYRGRTWLLEVKAPRGRLTAAQREFLGDWRGSPVVVIRTEDDVLRWRRDADGEGDSRPQGD